MLIRLAARLALASATARTITGTATTYGNRADASTGPVVIEAGALQWSADLSRVKLLVDHDAAQPVGYATAAIDSPTALAMTFHVPESPEGDLALSQAANGLRDGLSVGVWADDVTLDADGTVRVRHGALREVSLCSIPAFDDARVTDVAASTHPGRNTMPCTLCGQVHAVGAPCTTAPLTHVQATPAPSSYPQPAPQEPAPAPTTPPPAPPVQPVPTPQLAAPQQIVQASAFAAPVTPPGAGGRVVTLRQAARIVSDAVRSGMGAQAVRAALADITPAGLPGAATMEDPFLRDSYLGELWTASKVGRPFTDLLGTPKDITGLKVYGWRWKTRPTVSDYAGDKAEIGTSEAEIEPAESGVERIAAGWDIDRIYVDLGDASIIEALWTAATEDYRRKSEAKVVTKLLAAATPAGASASLPAALVKLGTTASELGANLGAVGIASNLWAGFASLTKDQVPWWLGGGDSINIGTTEGSVGGVRFFVAPSLTAGSYLALDPRAATFYEKTPPVRVNAVDLAHGGVDLGLFGYLGLIVNDARAIIKGTVA